jgi:hypothetical protein
MAIPLWLVEIPCFRSTEMELKALIQEGRMWFLPPRGGFGFQISL